MNYDFAQIIKMGSEQVLIQFTIREEFKDGSKIKKVLTGVDENGGSYTAMGVNDENFKINATQVTKII
jgi:hypothetical protein